MTKNELTALWVEEFQLDSDEIALDRQMANGEMDTPNNYINAGVTPDTYREWYEVGGFDINSMEALADAAEEHEIPLSNFGRRTDEGNGGYRHTIAYKFCNGDLDLEQSLELAQ